MRIGHVTSLLTGLLLPSLPMAAGSAHAQAATAADAPMIGAIRIKGIEKTQLVGVMARLEDFVGREADADTLKQLMGSITREARDHGYIFASVSVPPQAVRIGVLTVNLDPGVIDEVRISGSENPRLKKILGELTGAPGQKAAVERQLLLGEDLPGIGIRNTRYIKEGDRGVLVVEVLDDRVEGNVAIDNWGSESYGPFRLRGGVRLNNTLSDADSLTLSGTITPFQPRELAYVSGEYVATIGTDGVTAGVSVGASRTHPGAQPAGIEIKGDSRSASLFTRAPLKRTAGSSLWVSAEIAYLDVDQKLLDFWIEQDTSTSLTLNLGGANALAGGRLDWGLGFVRGLDLFRASHGGDLLLSRGDGSGLFSKQLLWFNWYGDIGDGMSVRIAGTAQHASRGLLAAHELAYGGAFFGRGYDFSEISGDDGVLGLIEIRRGVKLPWKSVKWAHVYGFVDGAWLDNKDDLLKAGSLFSAGLGARAGIGPVEIGLEGAFPLKRAPYGDVDLNPRFSFVLGYGL